MSLHNTATANLSHSKGNNDKDPISKQQRSALRQLTQDERRIMWVFSVIYEAVTQTNMQKILSSLNWKNAQEKKLSVMMEKTLREKLLKKKLLVKVQGKLACSQEAAEILAREALQQGVFKHITQAALMVLPHQNTRYSYYSSNADRNALRSIREALYLGDEKHFAEAIIPAYLRRYRSSHSDQSYIADVAALCLRSFDADWFASVPETIQSQILGAISISTTDSVIYRYLCTRWDQNTLVNPDIRRLFAHWRLHNGIVEQLETLLPNDNHYQNTLLHAYSLSLQGQFLEAIPIFESAQKGLRKHQGKRSLVLKGLPGLCFLLALLVNRRQYQALLDKQIKAACKQRDENEDLGRLLHVFQHIIEGRQQAHSTHDLYEESLYQTKEYLLLYSYVCHWLGEPIEPSLLKELASGLLVAKAQGNAWLVHQSTLLLRHYLLGKNNRVKPSVKKWFTDKHGTAIQTLLEQGTEHSAIASIMDLFKPQAPWERALTALQSMQPNSNESAQQDNHNIRLAWFIDNAYGEYSLQPKEQKLSQQGRWTKGRAVSLKRLRDNIDEFNFLTEQDCNICQCITCDYDYYGRQYYLNNGLALAAAAGHPHLFWSDAPVQPVELISDEPQLIVQEQNQQLFIQLQPTLVDDQQNQGFVIEREGQQRLRMIRFTSQHQQISDILSPKGLTVPISAKAQVLQSLGAIAPLLPIQSDIGGGSHATQVAADNTLYMHIQPQQQGLKFDLAVQPLGLEGPRFRPGEGRAMVMTKVNGERLQTSRQLEQERQQHQQLCDTCVALTNTAYDSHQCEWLLEEDNALEALYQLQNCGDAIELLWPKGGALKLSQAADVSQMQVSVRQHQDWFALDGELNLNDGQVLSMSRLLALLERSPGRFIRLGDDAFITLTEQLRQRLDALSHQGDKQHYHPLATKALEELTDGIALEGDKHWQTQTQRIEEAYALEVKAPVTLQAELRDYQADGLTWLTRLAHWGAGACLADDMGLGKTLQSLALIVSRAADGPTLILAPTSVCMNWLTEARRFAPTLKPLRFGEGDRQTLVDQAGPYDLIVCSYGLLQTEQARLQSVHWHTIVADEAQALKNPQAKRTQAAMQLQGNFKMVATGTPIENHLGELWTLFRFINPGLLGSQDSFNQRFAHPIENQQDKLARQQLKRLVQPFILRRLKTDVLTELPPRTEISINVPQNKEEAALYEAMRRQALEKLANNSEENPGQQRLKVLAEIMRLRRACCNPRLVMQDSTIPSSKLEAFGNIVDELRENHHRALVFSQFVDHLGLIRDYLDERGITYQYLDGSTSIKKREAAVEDFQKGEGELFLISLKAGGSGLNLTAADYVVHMDPWWNPAVEDQASDRAHRMGQTRPVTIYRLVSENTIEQKILALHSQKRDLADSLLAGTDSGGKLSADEVMALIQTTTD